MRWPLWRVTVAERSMEPALRPGDMLVVWRGIRAIGSARDRKTPDQVMPGWNVRVRAGQIVVARHPRKPEMLLVKRAAWLEPEGWWLTSDNPAAGGIDSFRFGTVRPGLIEGRVLGRYWPPRRP